MRLPKDWPLLLIVFCGTVSSAVSLFFCIDKEQPKKPEAPVVYKYAYPRGCTEELYKRVDSGFLSDADIDGAAKFLEAINAPIDPDRCDPRLWLRWPKE